MSHDQNEDMKTRFSLRSDTAVPRIPADRHAVITVCPVKSELARLSLSVGTGSAEPRAAHPCSLLVTWTRFPKRDKAVFNAQNHNFEKTLAILVESSCLRKWQVDKKMPRVNNQERDLMGDPRDLLFPCTSFLPILSLALKSIRGDAFIATKATENFRLSA